MRIYDAADLGAAIRQRRKALHYTQSYVSDATGFSVSFISDVERGKSTVELGKVLSLANLLGLDCEMKVRGE